MNIAMTKKLVDTYKIKIEKPESEEISIYNWHANIFYFERKKCIHFMNDRAKFNIVLFSVNVLDMKNIEEILKEAIYKSLKAYGVNEDVLKRYLEDCGSVSFSKTFDRKILGYMNNEIYFITWDMAEYLDFDKMNQAYVNNSKRKNIFKENDKIYFGIDLMKELLYTKYSN